MAWNPRDIYGDAWGVRGLLAAEEPRLQRRARKRAKKEFRRPLRQNRQDLRRLDRRYQQERARISAATSAAVGALGGSLAGLDDARLKGPFQKQAAKAISGLQADYQEAKGPAMNALRQDYADSRFSLERERGNLRYDRTTTAQENLADLLAKRVTRLQEQRKKQNEQQRIRRRVAGGTNRALQVIEELRPEGGPPISEFNFAALANLREEVARLGGFDRRSKEDRIAIERAIRELMRQESAAAVGGAVAGGGAGLG